MKRALLTAIFSTIFVLLGVNIYMINRNAEVRHAPISKAIDSVIIRDTVQWNELVKAIIWVESRGQNNAINKTSGATGCLQLMPIYVEEVNRIIGENRYSLADRTNRAKSIEMFEIYQGYYNPDKDLHLAIKLHNPKAKLSYHRAIEKKYKELIAKQ